MLPWIKLDSAAVAGGREELRLMRRGDEFAIVLGGNTLMSSRMSGSEEALASLALEKLKGRKNLKLLIGGLGMGFTLRAALSGIAEDARVTVAELVPAVFAWAQGPMGAVFAGCLEDPRVDVQVSDVAVLMAKSKGTYDAILLDVDNGPDGLTKSANDGLYSHKGLHAAKAALKRGGVLTVWSSGPDAQFTQRMQQAGFKVEVEQVRARRNGKGPRHVIWVGVRT